MNNSSTSTASLFSFSIFYLVLLVNIILYRLSPWHPLAKYPGPIVARVSKLWGAIIMAKGKNHENFKRLHDKYGPYVRIGTPFSFDCYTVFKIKITNYSLTSNIGPNEISVTDVSAFSAILGSDGMPKGPSKYIG